MAEADPPSRHRVLVAIITVLGVAVAAGGVITLDGRQRWRDAAAVASPQPAAQAVSPAPRPRQRPEPDRTKTPATGRSTGLHRLATQVAQIRNLPLGGALRWRLVSERFLADKVTQLAFDELDPAQVANDERLLVALRLAPPDIDLAGIAEALYREQVLGLYVPKEQTLYVRRRGDASPAQEATTAHEITHALQDRAFDMVKLQETYKEDADASLAVLSLIEGDAVVTQQLWAAEHLSPAQQQQASNGGGGGDALASAPDYLRASLFFPYTHGGSFVVDLHRRGGFAAVDAAFGDPPTTTEQILHPDRYRDRDDPVEVDVAGRPGRGWKPATMYAFGEFDLLQMLTPLGQAAAAEAGAGWDGGEVRSWSRGARTAVGAVLAFDTAQDATEACTTLPQWYAQVAGGRDAGGGTYRGDDDHLAVRCVRDEVHFGIAPSRRTARRVIWSP